MGVGKFMKTGTDQKMRTDKTSATIGADCARLCLLVGYGMAAD